MPRLVASIAALVATGCTTLPPRAEFPELGPVATETVLVTLNERAQAFRTLYAEIEAIYRAPDVDGTLDLVVHYEAPSKLRITAFKDAVLSVDRLFDLVLTPAGHRVAITEEPGRAPRVVRGDQGLADELPELAELYWAREAFCCPGRTEPGEGRVVPTADDTLAVTGTLTSGAPVTWTVDASTLRVRAAHVEPPTGAPLELRYSDWRAEGDRFVPGRVELRTRTPAGAKHIDARLEWVEVDVPIDPAVFALDEHEPLRLDSRPR